MRGRATSRERIRQRRISTMNFQKANLITYWISTGLIALAFVLGGAIDASASPSAVAFLAHLGYPAYFATMIGVWKVLGGAAVLAPRLPRLKEWAYAGIFFDLTSAAISHAATGDAAGRVIVPMVLAAVAMLSWRLRPPSRTMHAAAPEGKGVSTFTVEAA
jgi:uncharacterized membrane protein YphA (DoxX/SURF4 family)